MDPAQVIEKFEIDRHRIINETIARGDSPVQRFYDGAIIFITGGSGFLGKQLIEKLFRSCNIKKMYMLLRSTKQKSVHQRLSDFIKDPVFEILHKMKPDFVTKLEPIKGDITKVDMEISMDDWSILTNEVTVIFHGAATIHFTEPLKKATLTNVRGTQEILKLGKACKRLKSYVHISTAYSHATYERIKKSVNEQFYDCPVSPDVLIRLAETLDEKVLDAMTPNFIKNWPNTYSFTKAVAEELVRTTASDLPICIIRPAVVIGALSEPSPGWIEPSCVFGPSGFMLGCGLGALHCMLVDTDTKLDFVPVDLVNNAIIVAAKETIDRREVGNNDIIIYTITGTRSPIKFGKLIDIVRDKALSICTDRALWFYFGFSTKYKLLFYIVHFFLHFIPACLGDAVLWTIGKRRKAVKLTHLFAKLNVVYQYYLSNDWQFGDLNLRELFWNLSPDDRIIYNCNMETLHWEKYVVLWCLGIRKYILKDGINNTKLGLKKQFWFGLASFVVLPAYFYILWKIFYMLTMVVVSIFSKLFLNIL